MQGRAAAIDAKLGVSVFAPAKLNLYLHVVGRRADGYHLLDSLVAFADIGDEITAWPADELEFELTGRFGGAPELAQDNLVLKAARALAEAAGVAAKAKIRLRKELPVASGIGGGSADAAATLAALARLWGLDCDEATLDRLALGLGADVPVCRRGRAQIMAGIGEILTPAPGLPRLPVVLINPGVALPTAKIFAARSGAFSAATPLTAPAGDLAGLVAQLRARRNDLEAPARALAPEIIGVLEALGREPGVMLARMSGSGATCFGLFQDQAAAQAAARALAREHPQWWVAAGTAG